ncbi:MAG: SIR2 family protein, partial [Pseudomonadota bacterium]
MIRTHVQSKKRKLKEDQRDVALAIFEDPDTTRLIEVFQTAFESRRRDFTAEGMAQDCKEAFTAAYQSAMRSIDVTVSDAHALDWYRSLERAFKNTRRRDGSLYDPYGPRTNLPEMRQIVLSAWSVLANAKPKDRNDAYRAVFFSLAHMRNLDDVALKDWPDPIDSTVRSLGLTRLLTVNYDHELERYFRRRFGFTFSDFEVDPSDAQGLPSKDETDEDRQTFYNGSGVRLVRAEMQKTSVSELLDFAIPHDEDMHLYYLHGRASDVETTKRDDVILAERDYQRHYLENTVVRRGFDESLRALFAANTVIFLGIGMSEGDLLRPLREFVSDDQKWRRTSGGPIAIMNSGKPQEDESKVAEFNVNFGAKTIFYETYVDLVDRSPAIEGDDSDTVTGDDIRARVNLTDISDLKSKVEKILNRKKISTDWPRLNKAEKEALDRVQRLVSNVLHLAPLQPVWDKDGLLFLHTMLSRLETYVMTASLDRFLKQITPKHAEWLGEWTRLPDQRMARFVDWKGDFRCEE